MSRGYGKHHSVGRRDAKRNPVYSSLRCNFRRVHVLCCGHVHRVHARCKQGLGMACNLPACTALLAQGHYERFPPILALMASSPSYSLCYAALQLSPNPDTIGATQRPHLEHHGVF